MLRGDLVGIEGEAKVRRNNHANNDEDHVAAVIVFLLEVLNDLLKVHVDEIVAHKRSIGAEVLDFELHELRGSLLLVK